MSRDRTPEQWRDEIESGLEYRRRFGLEDKWSQLEAIYYNVHESMANDGPNIFLSQGDAMLSLLTVPTPRVTVKPATPEAVDKAPILASLDNTLLEELGLEAEVETACLHAYLWGRGFLKHGYDSEWGYDPSLDLGGNIPIGLTLTQLNKKGTRAIEYDASVVPGMPWTRAVLPHDIVVPWGTREISHAPWIANRVVRQIDDLKADRKYDHVRNINPQMSMEDFVNSYRSLYRPYKQMTARKEAEFVELWEIHEKATGKILAITWDSDEFHRNQENALQIDNQLPFSSLSFTPRARSFWTTPDAYYLLHVQTELSDVAVQRTKQRRLSVLKFLYDKNAISDEELQKLLSPDVGAAAAVDSGQELSKVIQKLENSPNQFLIQEEEHLRANAREQIGFSRNQLGEYTGGRKTAREVGVVERSSQLRMSRRGRAVQSLYVDSIKIINGIIFNHWTLPRLVRVIGQQKAEEWVSLNGPSLRGRYSYRVDLVDDSQLQAEEMEALQLYSFLAQDPGVDPIELRAFLINKFNNPAFERVFNANIRAEVLQRRMLAAAGGGVGKTSAGGGASRPPQMPALPGSNGQTRNGSPSGLMAR